MRIVVLCIALSACGLQSIRLPGAAPVMLDYLAYDRAHRRVWVPAGNTGRVDVIEVSSGAISQIGGLATREVEREGHKRVVGPSSATVGDGVVYVGNRGDSTVCAFSATSLAKGACAQLASSPDGLQFVASAQEVWVTTPRDQSIVVLDAQTLVLKGKITLEGEPEGFAVDDARGLFLTNFEDKNRTVVIDVHTRQVVKTWLPACADGPRGLALDRAHHWLFVACTDKVKVLDDDGRELSALDCGGGVDNLDYVEGRLYIGAARAARLTVATVDAQGRLVRRFVAATAKGARNGVATEDGVVYLADGPAGKVLVVRTK